MAEEAHAIDQVVQKALDDGKLSETDLSAVSVTIGPGLGLCLRGFMIAWAGIEHFVAGRFDDPPAAD